MGQTLLSKTTWYLQLPHAGGAGLARAFIGIPSSSGKSSSARLLPTKLISACSLTSCKTYGYWQLSETDRVNTAINFQLL